MYIKELSSLDEICLYIIWFYVLLKFYYFGGNIVIKNEICLLYNL